MPQSLKLVRRSFRFWVMFLLIGVGLSFGVSFSAGAWLPAFLRQNDQREEFLTKSQAKTLASKLVRELLRQPFFQKEELSQRVQFSLLSLNVQQKDLTEREFTDMVLNAASDYPGILAANQEPTMSVKSLDQKLFSYDNEWISRRRGVLLGADYILTGAIRESVQTDEKGRAYKVYDGTLTIKDIRKNNVVAVAQVSQNKKKLKRKR